MKMLSSIALLVSMLCSLGISRAQTPDKPVPGFSLTLAQSSLGGVLPEGTLILLATYTNISPRIDRGNIPCAALGAFYLETVRDGLSVTKDYPQDTGLRGALHA